MTDPPQSSPPARTFGSRLRRRLQQGLGFVYGTLLIGIFVNLVSNLLSFNFIFDWSIHHLLITGLTIGGLLLLTVFACWGGQRLLPVMTKTVSSSFDRQNRVKLLKQVRTIWIQGLLEQSLHRTVWIDLHLQEQPSALKNPWRFQVQELNQASRALPPGTSIVEVYDEADGELLILGEPGAGKTTLLLELTRTLIGRSEKDEQLPMPIIFNLSSWAEKRQSLRVWLREELWTKYHVPRKIGQDWIDADQILPLLDGLDEVANDARSACVEQINEYYQSQLGSGGNSIVICCRSEEYAMLSSPLILRRAVSILPLTDQQINTYLLQIGEPVKALRQALIEGAELHNLARQPLMLNIFTLTYQGAALVEVSSQKTREEVQHIIFARYIERMLNRRQQLKRWKPEQVILWLTFLAKQLQQHNQTVFSVENLQPTWLSRKRKLLYKWSVGLTAGLVGELLGWLIFELVIGLGGFGGGLLFGLVAGLVTGLGSGLLLGRLVGLEAKINQPGALYWSRKQTPYGLGGALGGGLVALLVFGFIGGLVVGLAVGSVVGLVVGLLVGRLVGLDTGINPSEALTWSWKQAQSGLVGGLTVGLGGGLVGGLIGGLIGQVIGGLSSGLAVGLAFGLVAGLGHGLFIGLLVGLSGRQLPERLSLFPNEGIWRSGKNGLIVGLVYGLIVGLIFGLPFGLVVGPVGGLIAGLVFGLVFGLERGLEKGLEAFVKHFLLRFFLLWQSDLPWNLIPFLDEAAQRLLLQKVGGSYIFVHRLLLDYFSSLEK